MPLKPSDDSDVDALGQLARSSDRILLVRHLRAHPGDYFASILETTGISSGSLAKYLHELEAQGIVTGDLPPEHRRGRTVRWSVDDERLRALIAHFEQAILG
ncbi:helix-turn-helix domain-containing protein [Puerhibacterium puerhi]|uniref:hypothetical protein n=1 Tax=Puerhibacterium puerhi TaxID=2692623 RepID=UPI00135687C3|nr:hypothetical protein [Puerhibacterium puerhi]